MSGSREAYLIKGIRGVGKTEFGKRRAKLEGGVCLSIEDFFYKILGHKTPNIYSLRTDRIVSSRRWFWMQLKKLCDKGISPIYVDQHHHWSKHTINTAGILDVKYDYHVQMIDPDNQEWLKMRKCILEKTKFTNDLNVMATHISNTNTHKLSYSKIIKHMDEYREFTVDELLEQY